MGERRKFMKKEKKQRVHNFQLKKQGKELPVVGKKGGGEKRKDAEEGSDTVKEEGGQNGDNPTEGLTPKKKKKKKKNRGESGGGGGEKDDEMERWQSQARQIRIEQLLKANKDEDKNIKFLERNLGIKKRKKKNAN